MTDIRDTVTRTDIEFYHSWAEANPNLFATSVQRFHEAHPITHWKHFVDMSLGGQFKLIAVRREQPFEDVWAYLKAGRLDGELYLSEIGMGR